MNLIKAMVAVVATLFFGTMTLDAQSVTPGNPLSVGIFDGYGHPIYPQSFTFKANVDLGSQFGLLRTVEYREFGIWNTWQEVTYLTNPILNSGIDEFLIPLAQSAEVKVHYRYLQDPDGNGPINIGDDAVTPVEIGPIQPKSETGIAVTSMEVLGPYLYVTVVTNRYVEVAPGGYPYDAHIVLEVENQDLGGATVWYDSAWVNPAGSGIMTKYYTIYLLTGGEICVTARMRYSHDGPGYSDFEGALVGQTPGTNCEFYQGLSTDTSELGEGEKLPLVVYPNPTTGAVTLSGVNPDLPVLLYSGANGQLVRTFPPQSGGELLNLDLSELSAGFYILRQEDNRAVKLEKH